ncbi:MAG: DUF2478 domain-containing protein [Paracoccaceae bacterium]
MLAFIPNPHRGEGDRILIEVAQRLTEVGVAVAGVVQINTEIGSDRPCLMDLCILGDGSRIRISQSLGLFSSGCRLNPAGLEDAVGRVESTMLLGGPQILILNKFGKAEIEGRGFRQLIGQVLATGVPVLTSVSEKNQAGFDDFAQGAATALPADEACVIQWCLSHIG